MRLSGKFVFLENVIFRYASISSNFFIVIDQILCGFELAHLNWALKLVSQSTNYSKNKTSKTHI